MSEFKFACPVCGQHITADSSATGTQLDCPTCFRKIIVPHAPASTESKFVLSASEANKPRPPQAAAAPPLKPRTSWVSFLVPIIVALGLFVALGAGLYFFRDKLFENHSKAGTNADSSHLAATNRLAWSLNLTDAQIPGGRVSGRVHGRDFVAERVTLQGGTLSFRMKVNHPEDTSLNIYLFALQPEELSGKSAVVTTNNTRSPKVTIRWKEDNKIITEPFTNGYAFRLEFEPQAGNQIPGRIYICLPDDAHSCLAGHFNAEIRKPSPPKPKPAN